MLRVELEKFCYYNRNKRDKSFNRFLAIRKQNTGKNIIFEVKNITEETKTGDFDYYELNNELDKFKDGTSNDNRQDFKRTISKPSSTDDTRSAVIRKKPKFLSG